MGFLTFFTDLFVLSISIIEFIGALLISGYMLAALVILLRTRNILAARLLVAEGALAGLSFKLAGTLLKTIELHTWQQILMFATTLALRVVLGHLFAWEHARLQKSILLRRRNSKADNLPPCLLPLVFCVISDGIIYETLFFFFSYPNVILRFFLSALLYKVVRRCVDLNV